MVDSRLSCRVGGYPSLGPHPPPDPIPRKWYADYLPRPDPKGPSEFRKVLRLEGIIQLGTIPQSRYLPPPVYFLTTCLLSVHLTPRSGPIRSLPRSPPIRSLARTR